MTLLFRSETLELLSNTLSVDDKYFQENRENIPKQIQKILSKKKPMIFVKFSLHFWNVQKIWNILQKIFSRHPLAVKKLVASKAFWNLHDRTLIILLHCFEINWIGKRLSYPDLTFSDCFLPHQLTRTSVLVTTGRLSCNQLKCSFFKKPIAFH